jgi:hypothetical protein
MTLEDLWTCQFCGRQMPKSQLHPRVQPTEQEAKEKRSACKACGDGIFTCIDGLERGESGTASIGDGKTIAFKPAPAKRN